MKKYTLPIENGTTAGMQLIRYEYRQIPQKAPAQPDELGGGVFRNCQQPQDSTGQQEDPDSGEMVDVNATTPEKYQKWSEAGPVAMTEAERTLRDAYDMAIVVEQNRAAWEAENAFLSAVAQINATYSTGITANDGFQDVLAKLDASTAGTELDRLKAGVTLRTLWDVCEYHGSTWKKITWHSEVE